MAPETPAPIAIVGGGPCGLAFANLLQESDIDFVVFERELSPKPSPQFQGGTLDLHRGTGQEVLRRIGLKADFERLARRDAMGLVVQDLRGDHHFKSTGDRDAPEIDRLQLRQMMLDRLPADKVRWGKSLVVAERDETKKGAASWVLRFADGSAESGFRLVVGADGSRSKLRHLILPAEPQYVGRIFIEGCLSEGNPEYQAAYEMVGAGNSVAMSDRAILCVQQLSDRSYRVYCGLKCPQSLTRAGGEIDISDTEKARAALLRPGGFYDGWAPHLRSFVAAAEGPFRAWPWFHLDPDLFRAETEWLRAPGIVLLGDAAHISSPNGEGVNQAMYDALVLYDRLIAELGTSESYDEVEADGAAVQRAIVAYESEMRPRAYSFIHRCIEIEKIFFSDDGAKKMSDLFKGNH